MDNYTEQIIEQISIVKNTRNNNARTNNARTNNARTNNITNDEYKSLSFFEKMDIYLFGIRGEDIWSKYKLELYILIATLTILLVILCFCFSNISNNDIINSTKSTKSIVKLGGGKLKAISSISGMGKGSKGGMSGISEMGGSSGMGNRLSQISKSIQERKDTIASIIWKGVMILFTLIVFLPSVTLFITIGVSYFVIKPKIKALKSI